MSITGKAGVVVEPLEMQRRRVTRWDITTSVFEIANRPHRSLSAYHGLADLCQALFHNGDHAKDNQLRLA
jgi:hypothetical protein